MKNRRVVVTGLGVVAPNGIGIPDFREALVNGKSGIKHLIQLEELKFRCQVAGQPDVTRELLGKYFTPLEQRGLNSTGLVYGVMAGMEAWKNAKLDVDKEDVRWDSGIIFGTGILGVDKFREAIHLIDQGQTRRLGSTSVVQTMASGISAFLNSKLHCGNLVTTNSSACTTGTEAILLAYEHIKNGKAQRMLAGSCGESGPYIWGGFDAMRILPHQYNGQPSEASRPMSATASGFVPGSGAGALVLENLETALDRGATIYAEILGGHLNSGGQRGGGSLTAPNPEGIQRCIQEALKDSETPAEEVDSINGHLTATAMDVAEVENWVKALGPDLKEFPLINSLKGMTGHCLSASGSIESVASVLQVSEDFVFPNINCEDLNPAIQELIGSEKVPLECRRTPVNKLLKASFGFGDVNAVLVLGKFN